jgi:small basic protein (TIGR04137 family)
VADSKRGPAVRAFNFDLSGCNSGQAFLLFLPSNQQFFPWNADPVERRSRIKGAADVSIDSTLKRAGRLARSRNVLKREERIQRLKEQERFSEGTSPLGLPKVRIVKTVVGKKKKKEKKEEAAADDKKKKK